MKSLNENVIFAIDLGGTQLRAALVDASGQILSRDATRTDAAGGPEAVIAQIAALYQHLLSTAPNTQISCAGISCPGPLDTREGRTFKIATLPGYDGFPFAKRARDTLGIPVVLEHDAHAAVFGEWKQGAGRGFDDFIYLTISTGLGGGAIVNGRLLRGATGVACHVGHMTIQTDGPLCGCGNRGCWEMFASGTSFLSRAKQRIGSDASVLGLSRDRIVEAADIFEAASKKIALAQDLVAEEAEWLGIGIVNLLHQFNPARIVMGGGMSANFDVLLPGIEGRIARFAMPAFRDVSIVKAELGDNAGLIGAAMLAMERAGEA